MLSNIIEDWLGIPFIGPTTVTGILATGIGWYSKFVSFIIYYL